MRRSSRSRRRRSPRSSTGSARSTRTTHSRSRRRRCTSTAPTSSRKTDRVDDEDRTRERRAARGPARRARASRERSPQLDEFVVRWQQTTGPVMAKGVEDTAFYRYYRLTALNEVGGDPGRFSLDPDTLPRGTHDTCTSAIRCWLLASQTHDTKRAGDVRARIGALAGMHERWAERVRTWRDLTGGMEDPNEEYLVWQTLVGAWPIVPTRLERYLEKALREAKRNTNWIAPNERTRAARQALRALALREPGVPRRVRAVPAGRSSGRRARVARCPAAAPHRARAARPVSG